MILTITLNPSVDIQYRLPDYQENTVNRVSDVSKTAGGKGLNVARVLKQLGEDVAASGFLGGSLGNFIGSELMRLGIQNYFVPINGETRNCIAIIHNGKQTEILESGPEISQEEAGKFLTAFRNYAKQAKVITISGSLPKGLMNDYYANMLQIAAEEETPVLLDTKGDTLRQTLQNNQKPYLIKPNQEEIADLLGERNLSVDSIRQALQSPIFKGITWVVVTLGEAGALVRYKDNVYRVHSPQVQAINPVGSGDSVIAGFASGISRKLDGTDLIKFGLAMGVLNVMEEQTGYINPANIDWCVNEIKILDS
ncbi:hexose kinase [Virgibacillus proomii]|uniref:hexose kinase n=1 Tax=Virgibacillus proomii TaxID=84407 RepID=UPI001C105A36|nr:hexose kinase [Virgibacillus proomii]MBU5268098.1 hexose kinase [Virgibacillus proomii]